MKINIENDSGSPLVADQDIQQALARLSAEELATVLTAAKKQPEALSYSG